MRQRLAAAEWPCDPCACKIDDTLRTRRVDRGCSFSGIIELFRQGLRALRSRDDLCVGLLECLGNLCLLLRSVGI